MQMGREHCVHCPQSCSGADIEYFLLEDQRDDLWSRGGNQSRTWTLSPSGAK